MTKNILKSSHGKFSYLVFFIILFTIIIDQGVDTILIESVKPLSQNYSWLQSAFIALSIPFSLFLAEWSDFHNRRKTVIFTLLCIVISIFLIIFYNIRKIESFAFFSLAIKAIGGNAIPIALAILADITPANKFRSHLALAICAISFGYWVPTHFSSFMPTFARYFAVGSIGCTLAVFFWVRDKGFDYNSNFVESLNIKKFIYFLKKSLPAIGIFAISPIVIAGFTGFIFGEAAFYQIFLREELLQKNNYYSFSLIMGLSYYVGTAYQFFLQRRKVTDIYCLKTGLYTSLFAIASIFLINYLNIGGKLKNSIFIAVFSFGFALFIPALFSILSNIKKKTEHGKIYGLLDSTDSIAVLSCTWLIKSSTTISRSNISLISLTLFILCFIILLKWFLRIIVRGEHERYKTKF